MRSLCRLLSERRLVVIPLFLLLAALGLGYCAVKRGSQSDVRSGGNVTWRSNARDHRTHGVHRAQPSAVMMLDHLVGLGQVPPSYLVHAALRESMSRGDYQTVQLIQLLFPPIGTTAPMVTPFPSPTPPTPVVGADDLTDTGGGVIAIPETGEVDFDILDAQFQSRTDAIPPPSPPSAPPPPPVVDPPELSLNQTLIPIAPEVWGGFLDRFKTQKPDFCGDNQLGAFEHNRRRLRAMRLSEKALRGNETMQRQALSDDLQSLYQGCQESFASHLGKCIPINNQEHELTTSGLIGLLKAAGPQGALNWIKHPEDRQRFPHTTEIFLRTNGAF